MNVYILTTFRYIVYSILLKPVTFRHHRPRKPSSHSCFNASLTMSPPKVAPAPNMAALPNLEASFLAQSLCYNPVNHQTLLKDNCQTYLWVVWVSRVTRILSLLRYQRRIELLLRVELGVDILTRGTILLLNRQTINQYKASTKTMRIVDCRGLVVVPRTYRELGYDGLELRRGQNAGIAEILEFCADGAQGAVYLSGIGHCEVYRIEAMVAFQLVYEICDQRRKLACFCREVW